MCDLTPKAFPFSSYSIGQERKKIKNKVSIVLTSEQEFQALNSSPVKIIGGTKNGNPTTVEQNSISVCQ